MTASALLGRESAVAHLRRAVDDALVGRGRFELIVGESGIGKTALAAEIADYAAVRDLGVLWATCWDGDGAPPYWPWVQVRRAYQTESRQWSSTVEGPPDVSRILSELADPAVGRSMLGDSRERFALFDAVSSFLLTAARARPLLVVVDDLQWADTPSLLLLTFLARQVRTGPLLVMGTFRDDEVGADRRRGPLLAQACGMGEVIALTGLATGEVEQLIGSMTGTTAGGLAADVFGRSGGNPFFVREVTQLLLSRGALEENAAVGGIPDGVRQVVAQRLARLPQASVTILTVAAVAGRDNSGDLLARVSGADIEQVAQRLDGAVRARMLVPPLGPAGPYRFTHDLFRETLYEGLTPSARAGLHLRVARALQVSQSNGSVVHPAELAHHLLLATIGQPGAPGSLADEAVRYGVLAAREAVARLAYEDAVGHVQRQLDGLAPAGCCVSRSGWNWCCVGRMPSAVLGTSPPLARTTGRRWSWPAIHRGRLTWPKSRSGFTRSAWNRVPRARSRVRLARPAASGRPDQSPTAERVHPRR